MSVLAAKESHFNRQRRLSQYGVEVGQAGLEPATSASSVPRSPN